ncbi:MAG: hypothetical protein MUQ65_16045, partial [Armatimonadetes bacterium]|nr:hypothetical protein [Armatimonadota bacterium]
MTRGLSSSPARAVGVVSRNSSVPLSAPKAVSRALDSYKGAHGRQDSTYSKRKEIAQESWIGLSERTGG